MRRKVLWGMLLVFALLAGCTQKEASSDDGKSAEEAAYYYQEERQAWEEKMPEYMPEEDYGQLMSFYETQEGEVWYLFEDEEESVGEGGAQENFYRQGGPSGNGFTHHILLGREGTFEEVPFITPENVSLIKICESKEGSVVLFDPTRAYVYPKDSMQYSVDIPAMASLGIVFLEGNRMICSPDPTSPYMVFDLGKGEKTEDYLSEEFLKTGVWNGNPFLAETDGVQLLVTGNGIYRKENEEWVQKLSSERTSLMLSGFRPDGVWEKDGDYYVTAGDTLYHYKKTEGVLEETGNLHIVSVSENPYLKEAIISYQAEHPEIGISYDFLVNQIPKTLQEMDELTKKMNTQIVGSEAADIYLLDGLPWQIYAGQGYLMDLGEFITPYLGTGEYYDGILTGCKTDGKLSVIPLYFKADYFFSKKEAVSHIGSLSSLEQYVSQNPVNNGLVPYYYQDNSSYLLAMLYHFYQNELYQNGVITKESITDFLSSTKKLYDSMNVFVEMGESDIDKCDYPQRYNMSDWYISDELGQMLAKKVGALSLYIAGEGNVTLVPQFYRYPEYELAATDRFHPLMMMGIHSNSKNKENAQDFLAYMLLYEKEYNQKKDMVRNGIGIPAAKGCVEHWLKEWKTQGEENGWTEGFYFEKAYGEEYPIYLPTEEEIELFAESLNAFKVAAADANPLINSEYAIIEEGAVPYLEGEKDLNQAAEEIYGKLELLQTE